MREISSYEQSDAFSEEERLVIEYAERLTRTPPEVDDDFFGRLRARFDERQLVELTAAAAWENYVGRFNRGLGVEPQGFAHGSYCVLPDRTPTAAADGR